jgi:hypothetical protein
MKLDLMKPGTHVVHDIDNAVYVSTGEQLTLVGRCMSELGQCKHSREECDRAFRRCLGRKENASPSSATHRPGTSQISPTNARTSIPVITNKKVTKTSTASVDNTTKPKRPWKHWKAPSTSPRIITTPMLTISGTLAYFLRSPHDSWVLCTFHPV